MDTCFHEFETGADHDSVETGNWPLSVEARTGIDELVAISEIREAATAAAPFIQVAH